MKDRAARPVPIALWSAAMWRLAGAGEDEQVIAMSLELYREDPSPVPVPASHARRTLEALRREPWRGCVVVLELERELIGYALVISFWSNELGGEVCDVDELFVASAHRSRGYGRSLFAAIEAGGLWPSRPVAITLIVTPGNARGRRLYEALGFELTGSTMVRRLARS